MSCIQKGTSTIGSARTRKKNNSYIQVQAMTILQFIYYRISRVPAANVKDCPAVLETGQTGVRLSSIHNNNMI